MKAVMSTSRVACSTRRGGDRGQARDEAGEDPEREQERIAA